MAIFSGGEERERKAKLKRLEDKRLSFAQAMAAEGFAPEKMLLIQRADGGYAGLCQWQGRRWLILSPALGSEADFTREALEPGAVTRREVSVNPEGMGGIFGFGKRGEQGVEYVIARGEEPVVLPVVAPRSSLAEFKHGKNPLLDGRRRRGDANVAWDLRPLELSALRRSLSLAEAYLGLAEG